MLLSKSCISNGGSRLRVSTKHTANTDLYSSRALSGTIDIPKAAFRVWKGGKSRSRVIHYEDSEHSQIPHVVKFSGGRSSGLMLLLMLKNGALSAARGDVVLFTNTSAEHPVTYDFVRKIKRVTEQAGIPFLIAQLQTIETVVAGDWRRRLTYRLANARPVSKDNPRGYSCRGEVFEEAIAWTGMLPSVHTRICTTLMKMFVTREFLSDWFAGTETLPQQGHDFGAPQCDPEAAFRIHQRNRGTMSREECDMRQKLLSRRPTVRPQQHLRHFTSVKRAREVNQYHKASIAGQKCSLFGTNAAPFLTFLGFRAGEVARYQRMIQRNRGEATPGHDTHPTNEYSYAPLYNLRYDQKDVVAFWSKQPSKMRPYLPVDMNLSNCVFCFLKGYQALADINKRKREFERKLPKSLRQRCQDRNTPNSLGWWEKFEKKHNRRSDKKSVNGDSPQRFGMFGLRDYSYSELRLYRSKRNAKNGKKHRLLPQETLNCECTD